MISWLTFSTNACNSPLLPAAYVKTASARGGFVRDVRFESLDVRGAGELVRLNTAYDRHHPAPQPTVIANVSFVDVRGIAVRAGALDCSAEIPCRALAFERVSATAPLGYSCSGVVSGTQAGCDPKVSCLQ